MESQTFKNFNPTGNSDVAAIKEMTDQLIDYVESPRLILSIARVRSPS